MSRKVVTSLICIMALTGLAQCGDESALSKQVEFDISPKNGIVINAPITLHAGTDEEIIVPAPWFRWNYTFSNSSDQTLVVATVTFKFLSHGAESILDPKTLCPNPDYDGGDTGRPFLIKLPPGNLGSGYTDPCDTNSAYAKEDWYIALPASTFLFYQIQVDAKGWFEDANGNQVEQFSLTKTMLAN